MPIFRMCITLCLMLGCITITGSVQAEPLRVLTWGGAYESSQQKAYFQPYTKNTNTTFSIESYNGGISELRETVESKSPRWDLVDLVIADNIEACQQGLLEKIDHSRLPESATGQSALQDFLPGTLTECGVGQIVSATVLAYSDPAFPGSKPSTIKDLFDLERFPGKRGLQKRPIAILEWALLSYGVPIKDLYTLLSTPRGLRMAFTKLDTIKDQIVWWENGSEPAELLANGDVVMSSGYNGRFFDAIVNKKLPLELIWHGQLINYSTWGVPKGALNAEKAQEFIRFATDTQRLADQAKYIAYGPVRKSSAKLVRRHADSGIDMRPHLPTYLPHTEFAIVKDHLWYARTQSRVFALFEKWLAEGLVQ